LIKIKLNCLINKFRFRGWNFWLKREVLWKRINFPFHTASGKY